MSDLRKLAEAATPGPWEFDSYSRVWVGDADSESLVEVASVPVVAGDTATRQGSADAAFIAAANPHAVIGLLDGRDAYRAFAVRVARMVASPGAEDTADALEVEDLGALEDVVHTGYDRGHVAGDRSRLVQCKEDLARALGLDVRRAPEWGEMVGRVRDVVRRADVVVARWEWFRATSQVLVLYFHTPGGGQINVAVIEARDDGMWSVKANGQKRTAADDLPAALATIRAVLGGDVPEIPNERSLK